MSLQLHDFFVRHTVKGVPSMIVDGENIVAHVHNPEYLKLFLHAPEMRNLIEKIGAMQCDPSRPEHDSDVCGICQARILLASLSRDEVDAGAVEARASMLG